MIIRIASHRAWHRVALRINRKPKGLFNAKYSGSYGLCEVSEAEWELIKEIPSVSRSRAKKEELMECWNF